MGFDSEWKRFFFAFLTIALFCAMTKNIVGYIFGGIFVVMALFSLYFFRDPKREPPADESLVLSPADGIVVAVRDFEDEELGECLRVGIFMSLLDVHVNRSPIAGTVEKLDYREGSFKHAGSEEAFAGNERMIIDIDAGGTRVRVMQIAGMIARRVVCRLEVGQHLARGEKIGIIRFGSRLEIIMPKGRFEAVVTEGERVVCGESPIARRI